MARSVKRPTLGFSSGHDLTVCEFKPRVGLHAGHEAYLKKKKKKKKEKKKERKSTFLPYYAVGLSGLYCLNHLHCPYQD